MSIVEDAVAAIHAGEPVVLPFDTVYGLASAASEEAVRRLYQLKGRAARQPTALVVRDVDHLLECIPELRDAEAKARALLPGPYTLILPNPAHRLRWLTGENENAIGIRVPALRGLAAEVLATVGVVAATSANRPGGPDPSTLVSVPEEIRAGAGAVVDGGALPGTPST